MLVPTTIALLTASLVRAATHTIVVGANGNTFNPTSIITNPGDVITFSFQGGNHTPTQSTFFSLCTALQGGESSGPMPASAAAPRIFNYTAANNNSVWFFCATGAHCKSGMVFAVNPTTTETFAAFQAAAKGEYNINDETNKYRAGPGPRDSDGASGCASIGIGAVAGALTLGVLAAI